MTRNLKDSLLKLRNNSWHEDSWFAPLETALRGVTAAEAAWQPPGAGNTIWQTLNHLNYFNERSLTAMKGGTLGKPLETNEATFGASGNEEDETGWQATVQKTRDLMNDFKAMINGFSEDDLDEWHYDLADLMMHDAYHTGEVVLIRKMQGSWPAERPVDEMW